MAVGLLAGVLAAAAGAAWAGAPFRGSAAAGRWLSRPSASINAVVGGTRRVLGTPPGTFSGSEAGSSLGGKVLRLDPATNAASADNPGGLRWFTKEHRNVQGIAVQPGTGRVYSVEHGTNRDDEVNRLVPGGNGGWDPVAVQGPDGALYVATSNGSADRILRLTPS